MVIFHNYVSLPEGSREWMGMGEWDYYWIVMDWIIPSFPTFSTRPVIIEKSTNCRECMVDDYYI